MTFTQVLKLLFLVVITACAVVAFGSGLFVRKKKYKQEGARERKLMRIRAICFIIMLVMLLLVIVI